VFQSPRCRIKIEKAPAFTGALNGDMRVRGWGASSAHFLTCLEKLVLNLKCCIADFLLCFSDFLLNRIRSFRDLVLVVLIARHNVAPFNCKEPIRCLAFFAQARLTHKYAYQSLSLMHRGPWAALDTTLLFKEIRNGRSRREDYP